MSADEFAFTFKRRFPDGSPQAKKKRSYESNQSMRKITLCAITHVEDTFAHPHSTIKSVVEIQTKNIQKRFGNHVLTPKIVAEMNDCNTIEQWNTKSLDDGYDGPKMHFDINYSTLSDEICGRIEKRFETTNKICDLFAKFYECFLVENADNNYLKTFFHCNHDKKRLTIKSNFFQELKHEREDIGEDVDEKNCNHIQQLDKEGSLHAEIFKFCQSKGLSKMQFLKFYKFKSARNENVHVFNLPSALKKEILTQRVKDICEKKDLEFDLNRIKTITASDLNCLFAVFN